MTENLLLVFIGLVVGVVNTLVGSGSAIVLPVLLFLGLPAGVANGTNRLGIIFQTGVSTFSFYKKRLVEKHFFKAYVFPSLVGALLGSYFASISSDYFLEKVVLGVILFVLVGGLVLWLLKSHKKRVSGNYSLSFVSSYLIFVLLGMYGGYIQVGLGLLIIGLLHFFLGRNLTQVNVIKNLLVFCYTIPVFLFFWSEGLVNWEMAIFLALGQAIGGYVGARIMFDFPGAEKWIRALFFVLLAAFLIRMLLKI